jgi:hypothetical protein
MKNYERINDNSLEHYFRNLGSKQGKPMGNIFGVHSQCRSGTFLSGSKWVNMVVCTSRVELAGVQIVSVIFLILGDDHPLDKGLTRVDQTQHKTSSL